MSDDKIVPNPRSVQPPVASPPIQQDDTKQSVPQQPVSPISVSKEHAPAAPTPDVQLQEVPQAPELTKELKEAGVEEGSDAIEHPVPQELKAVGVQLAKESTKLETQTDDTTKLPMTYAQAAQIQKTKGVKDSVRWLATFIMYQWKKIQQPKSQIQE